MDNYLIYENIELRALEPEDIDLLYQWENDSSLWILSNTKFPFSKYILSKYINESYRDIYETKQARFIIQTIEGIPVGAIDLFDFDPFHLRAGVGILIHNKIERNKGFASDALKALCNYSLHILGLHMLYANISAENSISLNLFKKEGFEMAGNKKQWLKTMDGWEDEYIFQKILG